MAATGLPPYLHPYLSDAQTKGINVIPTLWVIILVLGLGIVLRYWLQYLGTYDTGFIVTFLTHAWVTWKAGVKQMLVYIINVYLILNYADPSSTSSDIVSADSDGKGTDVIAFPMSISSNFLLNSLRFS